MQIVIREAKYKKLVRIRHRRHIVGLQQEIVVVGNPQRVKPGVMIDTDVRTERNPLDLCRLTVLSIASSKVTAFGPRSGSSRNFLPESYAMAESKPPSRFAGVPFSRL